ncbi:hypothetical protein niasHT_010965 [Heterodera trifolii]|uniref:Uncharacterized protein n=1 Tax=Heterodera trifolii TaxID=157864 RepID=A0ABD2LG36_9BILA
MNERQRGTNLAEHWLTKTAWPAVWCQELIGRERKLFSLNFGRLRVERFGKGEEVTDKVCGAWRTFRPERKVNCRTQRANWCECAGQKEPIVPNEESAEHKDKVPIDQRRTVPFLPSPIINLATQLKPINHKETKSGLLKGNASRTQKTEHCQRTEQLADCGFKSWQL